MRAFDDLTELSQARRLRTGAGEAARRFGLSSARIRFLTHLENAIYRVDHARGRFVLRLHHPGYHSPEEIAAELTWLRALRHDTDLHVPEPVAAPGGDLLVRVEPPGGPGPMSCTLLRWVEGRLRLRRPTTSHFALVGEAMARLHDHTAAWRRPAGFRRRRWDWTGLFGDGVAEPTERELWALPRRRQATVFRAAAERTREAMLRLGEGPEVFGLVHADLNLSNVLFSKGRARLIDFDDAGFGHHLYDLAVTLEWTRPRPGGEAFRDALLEGYARVRPRPVGVEEHLDTFVAGRLASNALWVAARALTHAGLRARCDEYLDRSVRRIRALDGIR